MRSQHYKQEQEKEQRKDEGRRKHKSGGGRPNQFLYHLGVTKRLYGTFLKEGLLAAILALPLWGIMALGGIKTITINADYWTIWLILLVLFWVQSSMFHKGG